MVKLLSQLTPAKLNLFLRVTGRRPDGYHELDSVFVPIAIYDRLEIELRAGRPRSVMLRCDSDSLAADDSNLASRAAREFMTEFQLEAAVEMFLHKEIPIGAGLGGGSSDAGAVLRMLAALGSIDDSAQLRAVALRLGADVPFFLEPAPARVTGVGERIAPLGMPSLWTVVAVPPIHASTAAVFRELRPEQWSGAAGEGVINALAEGEIRPEYLINDLEPIAAAQWPRIGELRRHMEAAGAQAAVMTGSGSAVFGVFAARAVADRAALEIRRRAPDARIWVAPTL